MAKFNVIYCPTNGARSPASLLEKRIGGKSRFDQGVYWVPSFIGIELFMWGHGLGDVAAHHFLDEHVAFSKVAVIDGLPREFQKKTESPKATLT